MLYLTVATYILIQLFLTWDNGADGKGTQDKTHVKFGSREQRSRKMGQSVFTQLCVLKFKTEVLIPALLQQSRQTSTTWFTSSPAGFHKQRWSFLELKHPPVCFTMRRDPTWQSFWQSCCKKPNGAPSLQPPSSPSQTLKAACFSCLQRLELKELCTFPVQPSVSRVSSLIEDVVSKGRPDLPQRRIRQLTLACLPLQACLAHSLCLHVVSLHLMSKSLQGHMAEGCCVVSRVLKASDTLLSDFELPWIQSTFREPIALQVMTVPT